MYTYNSGSAGHMRVSGPFLFLMVCIAMFSTARAATISIQKFEPSMGEYEFIAHIREHEGKNTALVKLPRINSSESGNTVQTRLVYATGTVHTGWTDIGTLNGSGVLTGATIQVKESTYHPLRVEVRLKNDTSVKGVMADQTFHAGTHIVLDGQSDVYRAFNFGMVSSSMAPVSTVLDEGNTHFVYMNRTMKGEYPAGRDVWRWALTNSTPAARRTASCTEVANMLHHLKPGRRFLITVPALSGMGFQTQFVGEGDTRRFEDEAAIAAEARLGGFHPGLWYYCISSGTTFGTTKAVGAIMTGINVDGSALNPGDKFTSPDGASHNDIASVTHTGPELWDVSRMKIQLNCPWKNSGNYGAGELKKHFTDRAVYAPYLADAPWGFNQLAYLRPATGDTKHSDKTTLDGAARFAMLYVHNGLSAVNAVPCVAGYMADAQWWPGGDKKYVIMRTSVGPATTWRRAKGMPRQSGKAEVVGFLINGAAAKNVTIRDLDGNLADKGYLWIKKNDGSNWSGSEVITRLGSFTTNGVSPFAMPSNQASNARNYDVPCVASGPSLALPLVQYSDVPGWAAFDTDPITPYGEEYDPDPEPVDTTPVVSNHMDAFQRIEAEDFDDSYDLRVVDNGSGGEAIGWIDGDAWASYRVDFGTGAADVTVLAASVAGGREIALRLGGPTGSVIGTVPVRNTGDFKTFADNTGTVSGATGEQTVYLTFSGELDVDYFSFSRAQTSSIRMHRPEAPRGRSLIAEAGAPLVIRSASGAPIEQAYAYRLDGSPVSALRIDGTECTWRIDGNEAGGSYVVRVREQGAEAVSRRVLLIR